VCQSSVIALDKVLCKVSGRWGKDKNGRIPETKGNEEEEDEQIKGSIPQGTNDKLKKEGLTRKRISGR